MSTSNMFDSFFSGLDSFINYVDLQQSNITITQEHYNQDPYLSSSISFLESFLTSAIPAKPYIFAQVQEDTTTLSSPLTTSEAILNENVEIQRPKKRSRNSKPKVWTKENDDVLFKVAVSYSNDWKRISRRILTLCKINKNPKFLRNRFKLLKNDQDAKNKVQFTHKEDQIIINEIVNNGKNWIEIANKMPHRAPLMIKNRYYYMKKKNMIESIMSEPQF